MQNLDRQKSEDTVNFLKEAPGKLYLTIRNIILFVPGLVAVITAGTLEGVPDESSMGPHINEYPQNKSSESNTWLEDAQQTGLFFIAALRHPRELSRAIKDYLNPEQ